MAARLSSTNLTDHEAGGSDALCMWGGGVPEHVQSRKNERASADLGLASHFVGKWSDIRCHIRRVRCTGTDGEPCYACLRTAKARNHNLGQVYCGYRGASCSEEIFDHINLIKLSIGALPIHLLSLVWPVINRFGSVAGRKHPNPPPDATLTHFGSSSSSVFLKEAQCIIFGFILAYGISAPTQQQHCGPFAYTLPSHTLPPGVPNIGGGSNDAMYRRRALPPPTSFDVYSPFAASSCSAEFQARSHSLSNTYPLALLNVGSSSTLARSGYSIGPGHSGPTAPSHTYHGAALTEGLSNSSLDQNGHGAPFDLPPANSRPLGSLFNSNPSLGVSGPGLSSSSRGTSTHFSSSSAMIPISTPTGPHNAGQPYYYPPGCSMPPPTRTQANQASMPAPGATPGATSSGNGSAGNASDVDWSNLLAASTHAAQSSREGPDSQSLEVPHSTRPQSSVYSPAPAHAAVYPGATPRSLHPSPSPPAPAGSACSP
ncbi:BQ2448_6386 [Microbotryum intermedium]|uniref:BQ2448_6386 protein n=1 Tax=Microbotryum intermedium TaxID=269621 RepID=A0A238FS70_9BASI|nr:BQ2448_6386 [Microbotryum intermedium]